MRLNLRVKQTSEHARGTVATLDEYSCECFRRGWKVRGRDSIHSGEEGEKKVKQVRVIARSQGTLTGLEFLPRKRLEKVRKEGGGRDEFESTHICDDIGRNETRVGRWRMGYGWPQVGVVPVHHHAT